MEQLHGIVICALTFYVFLESSVATACLHDMRSAMKEINRLQSQCSSGEYLDIETSTCKSCDMFCENGLHLERCGLECRGYFNIKKLRIIIAEKDEALSNAARDKISYLKIIKDRNTQVGSLKGIIIALAIISAVFLMIVIFLYRRIYVMDKKMNENPHAQAQDDVVDRNLDDEFEEMEDGNDDEQRHNHIYNRLDRQSFSEN